MITITHDMLGAYEVIAAGLLGSHFHPEIGSTVKDLIMAHCMHLDRSADLFRTEDPIKLVTFDYKTNELKTDMVTVDFVYCRLDEMDDFAKNIFYKYTYPDGTVIEDKDNLICPVAIIKD